MEPGFELGIVKIANLQMDSAERRGCRFNADHAHACRETCVGASRRVFEDDAVGGQHTETPCALKIDIGEGFGAFDLQSVYGNGEVAAEVETIKDEIDVFLFGV